MRTRMVVRLSMHWIDSNQESDRGKGGEPEPAGIFRSTDSHPINQMVRYPSSDQRIPAQLIKW